MKTMCTQYKNKILDEFIFCDNRISTGIKTDWKNYTIAIYCNNEQQRDKILIRIGKLTIDERIKVFVIVR